MSTIIKVKTYREIRSSLGVEPTSSWATVLMLTTNRDIIFDVTELNEKSLQLTDSALNIADSNVKRQTLKEALDSRLIYTLKQYADCLANITHGLIARAISVNASRSVYGEFLIDPYISKVRLDLLFLDQDSEQEVFDFVISEKFAELCSVVPEAEDLNITFINATRREFIYKFV